MSITFKVESTDINLLNDLQLTKLLKLLLNLEARSNGIAERGVEVALNINVSDGGEDGRIKWDGDPQNTNFLPCNLVQFQNKATTMGPADCGKELLNSEGRLKSKVEEVLDSGGAYILFTTQALNKNQKDKRIKVIREKLAELGKGYATTSIIEIYDASTIEGWVNKYLPTIVAVLNWIGKPLERGLKTWEDLSQHSEHQRFPFVADDKREEAIKSLRTLLNNPGNCARIIGLSGMGKTRLAFETLRDSDDLVDLSKRVVYSDAKANSAILGLVSDWVQCKLEGIVVVDNCEISLHNSLSREIKRSDSKLSMLTIDFNLDSTSLTEIIHLKQLNDEKIKQMLEPVYGQVIQDLDRIIAFAQGFPQMAVLLADARLDREPEMGRLTDDDMARKMLWGGVDPSPEDEQILKGCSLFDRFGMDDDVSIEYKFIAKDVVNIDVDKFFDCVKRFEERGLIDRRGRFASLVPKPLAIRLAAEWWGRTNPERQLTLIQSDMPGNLFESFCDQISRLDFLPEVKSLTADLCGSQGPFGQAEVILSERGSRLFRALIEVNPEATSKALFNLLIKYNEDELLQIIGGVRRNFVYALEKLSFHRSCFEEASHSLLLLASSENENWSNNATGIFKQLFNTFLSGTEAPPDMRLRLIDNALKCEQISIRKLAVEALEQVINTYNGGRMIGAEYQGSGEPLKEWRPQVWGEAFSYWEQALEQLCDLIVEKDPLAQQAKNSISHNIRGLMQYGRVNILDKVIRKIVDQDGPLWPEALDSIKDSIKYDTGKMPDEGKEKLKEWVVLLTPVEIEDRLKLIVSTPPFENEKNADGHYEDIATKNAKLLAEELSVDIEGIIPYIEILLVDEQRQAYWFAKYLVEYAGKWEPVLSEVTERIVGIENPNINFLLGILDGIFKLNSTEWIDIVNMFAEIEGLYQFYPHALVTGNVTIEQLNTLTDLIGQNKLEPASANTFTWGRPLEHLNYQDVSKFVENLALISDSAAWMAIDILSMYCHGDSKKWNDCKHTFKNIVVILKLDSDVKRYRQMSMHHWHGIVKKLLQFNDPKFAIDVSNQIIESCTDKIDIGDMWHYVQPIVRLIFKNYAKNVWPIFAEAIKNAAPVEEYRLKSLLSSEGSFHSRELSVLSNLPDDILIEWCFENPETAPEFVAGTTDVLLDTGDEYLISPRAKFLIDNFGDNERVLSTLSANLSSFGWSGSLVPYLKKEALALKVLIDHENKNVRAWIKRRLDYLNKMIDQETRREEEHDWGIH